MSWNVYSGGPVATADLEDVLNEIATKQGITAGKVEHLDFVHARNAAVDAAEQMEAERVNVNLSGHVGPKRGGTGGPSSISISVSEA